MKRTDDFLADLEAQLAAAVPVRRLRPVALLKPALVAVAVVTAVLGVARLDGEPERAAEPPARETGALITLPAATLASECGLERRVDGPPPQELLDRYGVFRRERAGSDKLPAGVSAPGLEKYVRSASQGPPTWLVPSAGVSPDGCGAAAAAGVCAVVELNGVRIACFTMQEIDAGRAAASLGPTEPGMQGFMVMVVPDGVEAVDLLPRRTNASLTNGVNDNSIVADLNGVDPGEQVRVGLDPEPSCRDHRAELTKDPPPADLLGRLPLLDGGGELPAQPQGLTRAVEDIGGPVHDAYIRRALVFEDGATVYLVPFSSADPDQKCLDGVPLDRRLAIGPGACLVAVLDERVTAALCRSLAEMAEGALLEQGRTVLGFPPDGAARASGGTGAGVVEIQLSGGVLAGDTQGAKGFRWEVPTARIAVLNGTFTTGLAAVVQNRLERAGFDVKDVGDYTDQARASSMVLYADGHAATAERVARELGVKEVSAVANLAAGLRARVGEADVIVVAGADLTR